MGAKLKKDMARVGRKRERDTDRQREDVIQGRRGKRERGLKARVK